VFHDILVCNSAREATLSYLAALLRNNEKRAQIQVDERSLAGDGFMLNILSIMQLLAVKVRISWKCMLFWTISRGGSRCLTKRAIMDSCTFHMPLQ
jgi:ubiquitin conjugation factor E4 B